MTEPILSADGYVSRDGKTWAALIYEHNPENRSQTRLRWRKSLMKSQYHAETAMEAAWQRLIKQAPTPPDVWARLASD